MENLPKWLQSSHDPEKVSLFIKGAGVAIVSILPLFALLGIPLTEINVQTIISSITNLTDNIFVLVNQFVVVCSLAVSAWGLIRKLWAPKN